MNSNSINSRSGGAAGLAWCAALASLLALVATLPAQTYFDFDNGTDTGWQRSTYPSTITYPTDALGGNAYRLQGTPKTSGADTNAHVYSFWTNRVYTNFYAAVDVVAWNTNQDSEMIIGLMARANGNDALPPLSGIYNTDPFNPDIPNGILFNVRIHNYRAWTGPGDVGPLGSADQMSSWSTVNAFGTPFLGNPVTVTQARFRWVSGRAYRLVMSSTNAIGDSPKFYTSSIYDVNDLTKPLLTMTGDDSYNGGQDYIPLYGYAGVYVNKLNAADIDPNVDVTFDNFYVGETAPVTAVVAPAIPHGKVGAPQVVNRSPVSFKNFHPATSGITFNATTLTTTNNINTSAIKLFLNNVDVSAGLVVTGFPTNASVAYPGPGLASNAVYSARIELQDALGRHTTNEWTFDTFSDAYLASSVVKVIEAEDYDFDTGQYINDPPASGYFNYIAITDIGTLTNEIAGYVDRIGSNARTNCAIDGVDFWDYDCGSHNLENQYRHIDAVGTQQGNTGAFAFGDVTALPNPYGVSQSYDTQRGKYSSLDPTLQEYIVERTEGGEWLNYTRAFDGSKTYNAYLRAAGGLAQPVQFDQIVTVGPVTNLLGQFNVPSTFFVDNYCYAPLVTPNGDRALVKLSGVNTVRLTMNSLQNDATRNGLSMNYVVLVPAAPQLYSSATVNGTYTPELSVLVNTGAKTITVPQSGTMRFYRVGWTSALTISGVTLSGPNVVLTYQ